MCDCRSIRNPLAITETWVDGIGFPVVTGKIVRLPCFVDRNGVKQLQVCLAMTLEEFLKAVQAASAKKIDYTATFSPSPAEMCKLN